MRTLSIDPSINNIGWAYFENGVYKISDIIRTKGETVEARLFYLGNSLDLVLQRLKPDITAIEVPADFSYKQVYGKTINQSALNKLNQATGVVIDVCRVNQCEVKLVPANAWKGRRNKEQDLAVARNYCKKEKFTDHEGDSILLNVYAFS